MLVFNIGQFHPLLVHLPIGILIFAFLLEIYRRFRPSEYANDIVAFALGIGALSAMVSLGTGWWLGDGGGYDAEMLFRHKWLAVALTVCSVLLYIFKKFKTGFIAKIYFPSFLIMMALLTLTGHYGGTMTHGEDFLFKDSTEKQVVITNVDEAQLYDDIVQPILDQKCTSCHNNSKEKGGLLLTSKEQILAGGDSGNILDSLAGEAPLFLHRLYLPLEQEEHMPPKGKVQLTSDEIALLEYWMTNKHCFDCTPKDLEKTEYMASILKSLEEDTSIRGQIAKNLEEAPQDWFNDVSLQNISASPLAKGSPLVIVNLAERKNLNTEAFRLLKKYAENIVELNLDNSNFNDDLASFLPHFENLTKLQLRYADITDKAMKHISKLTHLESLNLFGTKITNVAMTGIGKLSNLKQLYVKQTKITNDYLDTFKVKFPQIGLNQIDGTIFANSKLTPPRIVSDTDFFTDSIQVSIENPFKDANLYYTTNGLEPDTTSAKYIGPLIFKESTTLKVFSHKKNWKKSDVGSSVFKKSGVLYDSVWLTKPPHKLYGAEGGKSLVDLKRGTAGMIDKDWIGYHNSHFTALFKLKGPQEIEHLSIGALTMPAFWIMYPAGCTVWVSGDGSHFKKLLSENFRAQKPTAANETTFYEIDVPPTTTSYIKIEVKSALKNPSWHTNPGKECWVFVDEIIIN